MNLTRRHVLAGGAAAATIPLIGLPRGAKAAVDTVTIAYHVNLPSFDPTVGLSATNPTIQSIYQSVFDQFIPQNPDLSASAGHRREVGLERRPLADLHGHPAGRDLARRNAAHRR